jgi:hypothetical protein
MTADPDGVGSIMNVTEETGVCKDIRSVTTVPLRSNHCVGRPCNKTDCSTFLYSTVKEASPSK